MFEKMTSNFLRNGKSIKSICNNNNKTHVFKCQNTNLVTNFTIKAYLFGEQISTEDLYNICDLACALNNDFNQKGVKLNQKNEIYCKNNKFVKIGVGVYTNVLILCVNKDFVFISGGKFRIVTNISCLNIGIGNCRHFDSLKGNLHYQCENRNLYFSCDIKFWPADHGWHRKFSSVCNGLNS
ncbi:hypothetical protein MHBO_000660 [Bonamia ostreae]|uniref:Uncharacterized protein n=1 Tax=Bonamia ostreae TaxID=126728 RepID=A0ABV2AGF2_9EUKA